MVAFRTYAEVLGPDHPLMKIHKTSVRWRPSRYRPVREIAELTSDEELRRIADLPEVPVSLEHLRQVDPQTRILIGYRLDGTPAESPDLRRRLALQPDPRTTLHFDEVVFAGTSGKFWAAMRWEESGQKTDGRSTAPHR
jgi:hypothetical protein